MKILHVSHGYYPALGGVERLMQNISEELARQFRDDVTVFTTNCYNGEAFMHPGLKRMPAGWEEINGVRVRRFPVFSEVSAFLRRIQPTYFGLRLPYHEYVRTWTQGPIVPGLGKAIEEFDADVVSAASFPLNHMYIALHAAQRSGKPIVMTGALHPDDLWGFNRPMIYRAIGEADAYIALTEFEAQYVQRTGVDAHKIFVAGGGVDAAPYLVGTREEARERLGLGEGPLVGFIGQVTEHKLDMLVDAMPKVWEALPEASLLIAGSRTLYDLRLQRTIASWRPEWQKRVTLRYNFPEEEKPLLYSAIDVLAYPSYWESFGIAYVEAWAAGKPVIGCDRGAVSWLVEAGRDGLLVKYKDEAMLAEAILLVLQNPVMAKTMGEAGREKTLRRYTWGRIGSRYREIYSRALECHRAK